MALNVVITSDDRLITAIPIAIRVNPRTGLSTETKVPAAISKNVGMTAKMESAEKPSLAPKASPMFGK